MKTLEVLKPALKSSAAWTALLTLLFFLFNRTVISTTELLITLPFFIVFYYLFFIIGKEEVSSKTRVWIGTDISKVMLFPALLILLYFFYVLINKHNPVPGTLTLVLYLVIFPVLLFVARRKREKGQKIDWLDFTALVLFLLPTAFIDVNPAGNLPFNGNRFDSIYRIAVVLTAVYTFAIINHLDDTGFFPSLKWKNLWTSIWVWFLFYLFVLIVGFGVDFIKYVGHDFISRELLRKIVLTLVVTFLHTAIFEELFFRGILQNMLAKRIAQTNSWKIFMIWGFVFLLPLAFLVGYTLHGGMQWFPALMITLLFAAAYGIERTGKNISGVYTSLAITSGIFGLVHYHSGAIVYIGFACLAGWAYGYTYIKTRNVFCSALVHTLVNSSVLIFGLEYIK